VKKFHEAEKKSGHLPMILKLDKSGSPCAWSKWQDIVVAEFTDKVIWRLGDPIDLTGGTGKDGTTSQFELYPVVAVDDQSARKRKCAPALTNRILFLRDHHTCAYCGHVYMASSKLSRDHVIPTSKGGQNTWNNCVTACKQCNTKKSDRLLSECGMVLRFKPFTLNNFEHLILQNKRILPVQLDYLIKGVSKNFHYEETV